MYCVGKFQEKGGISFEVFPEKWLHGEGLCYWPKSDQQKAIRLQRDPDKSWNLFPIEAVLGKYGIFFTYRYYYVFLK